MTNLNDLTGIPGHQVPLDIGNSTSTYLMNHNVGFRRPHVAISTAAYRVTKEQTGTFFTYGGYDAGITITFPAPEPGLWFELSATGAIATAVTVIKSNATGAFVRAGDSGGCDALVSEATTAEFGAAGGGLHLELIGVSTSQYLARQWSGASSVASTAQWKASS